MPLVNKVFELECGFFFVAFVSLMQELVWRFHLVESLFNIFNSMAFMSLVHVLSFMNDLWRGFFLNDDVWFGVRVTSFIFST